MHPLTISLTEGHQHDKKPLVAPQNNQMLTQTKFPFCSYQLWVGERSMWFWDQVVWFEPQTPQYRDVIRASTLTCRPLNLLSCKIEAIKPISQSLGSTPRLAFTASSTEFLPYPLLP